MSVLATRGLTRRFGTLTALDDVSIALEAGARHAVIGPNGAGKTTLVDVLTGALAPSSGEVALRGEPVTRLAQHERARRGLTRTYQVNRLFAGLTVHESVVLSVLECERRGAHWWRDWRGFAREAEEAMSILAGLGLESDAQRLTGELPYGRQRLVEIALALATRPAVLLLDEPAAGISAHDSDQVLAAIEALPPGTAVLFIEHDMDLVFRFARTITVLVAGRVLAEGPPERIAADERVRAVYLGTEANG